MPDPQPDYSQEHLDMLIIVANQRREKGISDAQILADLTPAVDVWRGALQRYLRTGQRTL